MCFSSGNVYRKHTLLFSSIRLVYVLAPLSHSVCVNVDHVPLMKNYNNMIYLVILRTSCKANTLSEFIIIFRMIVCAHSHRLDRNTSYKLTALWFVFPTCQSRVPARIWPSFVCFFNITYFVIVEISQWLQSHGMKTAHWAHCLVVTVMRFISLSYFMLRMVQLLPVGQAAEIQRNDHKVLWHC